MERQTSKDYTLRLTALRAKLADAEVRLTRLYTAIESGIGDPSAATLKDRIAAIRQNGTSRKSRSTGWLHGRWGCSVRSAQFVRKWRTRHDSNV
jgi:hypothetical protein